MGLLEKLKNTFFEEEYIEVEEEKKEKPIARKVETKLKKAEKVEESTPIEQEIIEEPIPEVSNYSDSELLKRENNIQYFDEEDFVEEESSPKKSETTKLYGEDSQKLYSNINIENEENHTPYANSNAKSGFKPTPIISPIYGILDKNYRKEEVIDKKDKPSSYVSRRNADLDFVRNKAFGNLEDDMMNNSINNQELASEEDNYDDFQYDDNEMENRENLLVDMTDADTTPAVDKVTIADAEEYFEDLGLEYNIDYKDSRYEKATGRRSSKAINKEKDNTINEQEQNNLEDNLFDLVDSMYEEKE